MPYGRRYRKRPYRRRRRTTRQNKPMGGAQFALWMAQQAMKNIRYIKGLVNSEKFVKDTTIDSSSTSTGVLTHLSGVAQGDAEGNRTGQSIYARSLSLRGQIISTSTTPVQVRLLLIRDTQQIGDSSPSAANVLEVPDQLDSFLTASTRGRFSVLWDKTFLVSGNDTDRAKVWINVTIPMRSHIRYNGSATSDIQKNGLYLLNMSDSTDGAGTKPTLNLTARLYYHDN